MVVAIQLIPEDCVENHVLMSDVVSFIPIYTDSMGNEEIISEYSEGFEFNALTGELKINDSKVLQTLDNYIAWYKEAYAEVDGYEGYIVLQFNIEKYRDITVERSDITSEEAHQIATMQSAHASILEYIYQFTLAQETQERLNEIAYTIFVTITSTIMSIAITGGLGKLFDNMWHKLLLSAKAGSILEMTATSVVQRMGMIVGDAALNTFKVICSAFAETGEELGIDPWIEAWVSNKVKDLGGSEFYQIFLSCFAESGRETFLSSPVDIMREGLSSRTQMQMLENLQKTQQDQKIQSTQEIKQGLSETTKEVLQTSLSTVAMFAGALTGGFLGSLGTVIGSGLIVMGGLVDEIADVKDFFKDTLKARKQSNIITKLSQAMEEQRIRAIRFELLREATSDWSIISEEMKSDNFFTDEALEKTDAMLQYHKEMESYIHLLEMSAKGLAYLLDNPPSLERAREKALTEHIIKETGLSRQEIFSMVEELKSTETEESSAEITTKNALEILMKNLDILTPHFYKDGTLIQSNDDRDVQDPLNFLDWFVAYRPNSKYVDSFRRVRSHFETVGEGAWRTPLDRDPVISHRVKILYERMRADSRRANYVIYALMQKRDLYTGAILSNPIFEVGRYTNPRSMEHIARSHKIPFLRALKKKAMVYFRLASFEDLQQRGIIPQSARFEDYFEAVPIDIAATLDKAHDFEIFYTIYVNRMNGKRSYDLKHYNELFNSIVGDKYDPRKTRGFVDDITLVPIEPEEFKYVCYVTKEHLDSAIELGLNRKDLIWYFKESHYTIKGILNYHYPGKSWSEIQEEVIGDRLKYLASEGVFYSELIYCFYKGNLPLQTISKHYKDPSFIFSVNSFSYSEILDLLKRNLGGIDAYNKILFEKYLKRELIKMSTLGIITRKRLIDIAKGVSDLPYLDPSSTLEHFKPVSNVKREAYDWIFLQVFESDIMKILSQKNYGRGSGGVPISLLVDLDIYDSSNDEYNNNMASRLKNIIELMFGTSDFSKIYRYLNSGTL